MMEQLVIAMMIKVIKLLIEKKIEKNKREREKKQPNKETWLA